MLAVRMIPCLDVADGRVVKGVQFQGLRDSGDPIRLASNYEQQGADEIVILDVSATPEGRNHSLQTTAAVRKALSIPLTVGGGVRSVDDARSLLEAGADKVAVNSAAVANPGLINAMSQQFGSQCTVVAIDAASTSGDWEVVVNGGRLRTGLSVEGWVTEAQSRGAGEILLTSWDRDGTGEGYDTDLLRTVATRASIPIIASGGAASPQHLVDAIGSGASAVLVASLLHDEIETVSSLKNAMSDSGLLVRL